MDRLQQIRAESGGSQESSLDGSSTNEAFLTANDTSKFFSLTDSDSSFNISIKEVDTTPTSLPESPVTKTDNVIPDLSPVVKKSNVLDGYKIGKQIEAANILSGGVNIFDDNDNSYDGNELVIDDHVGIDTDDKPSSDIKALETGGDMLTDPNLLEAEPAVESKDTEVVLQIDGRNVDAIDIGNGLYLYRKEGQEELAAVQIIDDDQQQPSFKFLKVRENVEGNLEVYEEIEIEVPKEIPQKMVKPQEKKSAHVPIKDISKVICEPVTNKVVEQIKVPKPEPVLPSNSKKLETESHKEALTDGKFNLNMKMKANESRKSPLSFTPISFHSTPNKEGVPLTKTMVDLQLQPSRHSDNVKKTIEVHTDVSKQKSVEPQIKSEETKNCSNIGIETELSAVQLDITAHTTALKTEQSTNLLDKDNINDLKKETELCNLNKEIDNKNLNIDIGKNISDLKTTDLDKDEIKGCEVKTETIKESIAKTTPATTDHNELPLNKNIMSADMPPSMISSQNLKHCEKIQSVPESPKNTFTESKEISDSQYSKVMEIQSISNTNLLVVEKSSKIEQKFKIVDNSDTKLDKDVSVKPSNADSELKIYPVSSHISERPISVKTPLTSSDIEAAPKETLKPVQKSNIIVPAEIKVQKGESGLSGNIELSKSRQCHKNEDDLGKKDIVVEKQEFDPKILNTVETLKLTVPTEKAFNDTTKPSGSVTKNIAKDLQQKSENKQCLNKSDTNKDLPKVSNLPIPTAPSMNTSSSSNLKKMPVNITHSITSNKSEINLFSNVSRSDKQSVPPKKEIALTLVKGHTPNDIDSINTKANLQKPSSIPTTKLLADTNTIKSHEKVNSKSDDTKTDITEKKDLEKVDSTSNANKDIVKNKLEEVKPVNNNSTPVPFGKWTEANRQEFLNKFKEVKVPSHPSSSQQLKQANDLNRRDVLKKIDKQRQTSNAAAAKAKEIAAEMPVKIENHAFTNVAKSREVQAKGDVKLEDSDNKTKPVLKTYSRIEASKDIPAEAPGVKEQRKDINNQDLIDKTIEDMLNKPLGIPTKGNAEEPLNATLDQAEVDSKPSSQSDTSLDAIEMKMNELHGIPFVERPVHELPKVVHNDTTNVSKTESTSSQKPTAKINTIPKLLTFNKPSPNDIDIDEDEIIEHEPVTGDTKVLNTQKLNEKVYENKKSKDKVYNTKSAVIITEKDFDKFARRNSITYENKITVNFGNKEQCNVVQTVVEKGPVKSEYKHERLPMFGSKPQQTQPLKSNVNKNRNSMTYSATNTKVQQAYNMTLSAKMQKKPPISILEDKPVKVVYMESSSELLQKPLNVQGQKLSPKQAPETDLNLSSCDSLDSDVLDAIDGMRSLDDIKYKTKHQRKQVLTPVEAPDLELIEPEDIDICSPKKKRRIEHKPEKDSKVVVPKKSYLLGRAEAEPAPKSPPKLNTSVNHKSAASAIDNLVKAAELLETQSAALTNEAITMAASNAPLKRGRGRPRKYPVSDGSPDKISPIKMHSPQKKPRFTETTPKSDLSDDDISSDEGMILENWTMGKINDKIVCPICNKLFRSENVVFKHVKHCTGPSPSRSDSDKRSPSRHSAELDLKAVEVSDTLSEKKETKQTPRKRKSRDLAPKSLIEDVIVLEDTPIKEKQKLPRIEETKSKVPKLISKQPQTSNNLVCEFCGKTFRQLSYLVSHKLQHKKEEMKTTTASDNKKSVFSCEVCKKEFRKLHHLVQHRIIHNPSSAMPLRPNRKSSSEQNDNKSAKIQLLKQNVDQSAGFRCEPCDKSFRKLHHLVEHRETHDGINRLKNVPSTQTAAEKTESSYQCDLCKREFKSMELMMEHREQHLETSSEKSDDKSSQSALSAKDIIHECALCYMVFPNEHSLTKHTIICQRKKRQSASKAMKSVEESTVIEDSNECALTAENNAEEEIIKPINPESQSVDNTLKGDTKSGQNEDKVKQRIKSVEPLENNDKNTLATVIEKVAESNTVILETSKPSIGAAKPVSNKSQNKLQSKPTDVKKKTPVKDKVPKNVTKRKRSLIMLPPVVEDSSKHVESSDDDEVRYMLNPNFKEPNADRKQFMRITANKRNSLQLERPSSKDLVTRRTSLQHPPKIPRLKTKALEPKALTNTATVVQKPSKEEPAPATDSDDSDVKYSFPVETTSETTEIKTRRKSLAQKRKSLNGIAKRKSMGITIPKPIPTTVKPFKRRVTHQQAEHRCDCGQLFSSAALLSRHATLAHTPPRIRRRRTPPPAAPPAQAPAPQQAPAPSQPAAPATRRSLDKPKPTERPADTRKSTAKPMDTRKSIKLDTKSSTKPRRTPSHKNIPLPEKVKKILEKSAGK